MDLIFDSGLTLYLPFYRLDGSSLISKDAYGHSCTVNGAAWRTQGRYFDGIDDRIAVGTVSDFSFIQNTGIFTLMSLSFL